MHFFECPMNYEIWKTNKNMYREEKKKKKISEKEVALVNKVVKQETSKISIFEIYI